MKALVYLGDQTLAMQDQPDPEPSQDEILIKVAAVGICGSDMHAYLGHDARRPPPLILGHEACGIAQSGRFQGKHVVVNPLVTCGVCDACLDGRSNLCPSREIISMAPRQGAFAELIRIPERNAIEVPQGLSPEKAALAEPIATSFHAVTVGERHLWRPVVESQCLVIGAGAVGLAAALILRARGVRRIVVAETNGGRRQTALDQGGFEVVNPIDDLIDENAFDLVIDAVGGPKTRELGCRGAKPGGVFVHIGLMDGDGGMDVRKLTLQEITFVGVYTYTMVDFRHTLAAMASGALGPLDWFVEEPLSGGAQAFQDLLAGTISASKVVLRP